MEPQSANNSALIDPLTGNAVANNFVTIEPPRSPALGFGLLLALLALVAAGKVILADNIDPDCFWHLRVGAQIAEQIARHEWPGPIVDNLSFASIRQPWTPYSWLAEVGMKKLWDVGGFQSAVALQAVMESAFILFLGLGALEATRREDGRPRYLASAAATTMGGVLSLSYLSFRPVTAALAILSIFAWLLLRDRRMHQTSRLAWIIPPLTAILTNIHFFAVMVPLWTGALLAGDWIENRRAIQSDRSAPLLRRRILRGSILFILCAMASAMTPMLAGTIRSVIDYSSHDVMVQAGRIAEMQPFYAGFMGHISAFLVGILGCCLLGKWIGSRRAGKPFGIPAGEMLWLAGSTVLLFRLGRMATLFAIIAVPIFALAMPKLSDRILTRRPIIALLATILAISAWPIVRGIPMPGRSLNSWLVRHGPDVPSYPCAAADFVDKTIPASQGKLICEFTWGGYLEWRLGPRFQTLMDGRTQVFSADFWRKSQLASREDRKKFLASTPADVAVVGAVEAAYGEMLLELGWTTVYRDAYARVLVPPVIPATVPPAAKSTLVTTQSVD